MIVFPELYQANALYLPIADNSVDCVVTSPPYWGLRDYHVDNQLGMESTPEEYCNNMTNVFREIWRVLKPTGTVWLNLGDSYVGTGHKGNWTDPKHREGRNGQVVAKNNKVKGLKSKDLVGIPWRVAFALQTDGWYLRSDIIWSKPNPMPESVKDRPTKAHEYIFLLTKSKNYYYDADAIREKSSNVGKTIRLGAKSFSKRQAFGANVSPSGNGLRETYTVPSNRNKRSVWEIDTKYSDSTYGGSGTGFKGHSGSFKSDGTPLNHPLGRNKRSGWSITTKPYTDAHFATFPEDLIEPCILAGSPEGGFVLDPFVGSGTTMVVAQKHRRKGIGIDLNKEYLDLAVKRIKNSKYNNQFVLF